MEIEHVARIRLAARRAAQDQRHLPVRRRLLGQVVVDAEGGLPLLVHEVLGDGAARVRGDELQRRRVRRRRDDHDRIVHRAGALEPLHDRRHGRALLPDRHVDTDDAGALLVDDRVDRDRGLAGAAVADDELTLSAADRDHRVDRLDTGLQRLLHRLPHDDARRDHLHRAARAGLDRPAAVHRLAERVDDPAKHRVAGRHIEQPARGADLVALLEPEVVAHDRGADIVLLEVEHQPVHRLAGLRRGELEHLSRDRFPESVDPGDAVLDLERGPDLGGIRLGQIRRLDLAKQDVLDFAGPEDGIGRHVAINPARMRGSSEACEIYHKAR